MAGTAATEAGGALGLVPRDEAGAREDAAGAGGTDTAARGAGGGCGRGLVAVVAAVAARGAGAAGGAGAVVTGAADAAAEAPSVGATMIVSSVPAATMAVVTAPARSSTRRVTGGSALFSATRTRRTIARPVSVGGTAPGDTPGRSMKTRGGPSVVGVAVAAGSVEVPRTVIRTYGPSRPITTPASGTPDA